VPDIRTRLKQIGDVSLVLRVSGGGPERPVHYDVLYPLPAFLHAR
jgi:hypothetical protein